MFFVNTGPRGDWFSSAVMSFNSVQHCICLSLQLSFEALSTFNRLVRYAFI